MSGGRRKSRKPQKWEDFVADEEQLATLEKELEKEEKARMLTVEEGGEGGEQEKGRESDSSDDETNLEIVMEEEDNSIKEEEKVKEEARQQEHGECVPEGKEPLASPPVGLGGSSMVGDCTTCGIQLRDWPAAHSHLRFHRLSHVPDCIYKVTPQTKRINCQVCQRSCQNREVLAYHAYTEHYVRYRQTKTCPFCCSTFSCLDEFLDHLDITNVSFKCQMCGISVNQEHKFYQHIVYCCKKSQSGLTAVPCCVCGTMSKINRLYDHLTQHSTQLNLPRHLASNTKRSQLVEPCLPKPQSRFRPFLCEICDRRFVVYSEYKRHLYSHSKSRAYVCTHCGRSYCQKNTLIVHLYSYHNSSPNAEEVTPREDRAQRWCEVCGRSGFLSDELLVRHCVMRCPKRNNLQASFAVIIASIAKNQNSSFLETLRSPAMVTYLKLGLEAWRSPPPVREFLEALQLAAATTTASTTTVTTLTSTAATITTTATATTTTSTRKESTEFTDIQLLAYLSQFEEKNCEKDKELEFLINYKSKGISGQGEERKSPTMEYTEGEGEGVEESLLPFLCTTTTTSPTSAPQGTPPPYPSSTPQLNHTSLMQHLRRGGEKRGTGQGEGGGGGEGGSPVDICLVTSTTNTQVTITPAGHHLTQDMRPPKVAKVISHKPSVAELKALYPGISVLSDVDFSRVPSLILEMRESMSDRIEREMEETGITPQDLQRLEVEAQLLREAEPFYLQEPPCKEGEGENGGPHLPSPPSPSTVRRLAQEIWDMCEAEREENGMLSSPSSPDSLPSTKEKMESAHALSSKNMHSLPNSLPQCKGKGEGDNTHNSSLVSTNDLDKFKWDNSFLFPPAPCKALPPPHVVARLLREAHELLLEG